MPRRIGALVSILTLSAATIAPIVACGGGGNDENAPGAGADAAGADAGVDSGPPLRPTGTIIFPKIDVWTPETKGRVLGTATPPPSRTIVQVTVNGKPATTTNGYAEWTADVDLARGPNPLTLVVIDSTGETSTATGSTIASTTPMRNGVVSDALFVKEGTVYAGDYDEIVSFHAGGGPRTTLAKIDGEGIHHLAIDGSTLYIVTRSGTFGSIPVAGGTFTAPGKVATNMRAMAVAGGKLVLFPRFASVGTALPTRLASYPLTGGDRTDVPLTYGAPLDFEISDYDVANGSFYVVIANHKPLVIPLAGGAVTDLDVSRNTGAGDEYPKLIKVSGGKVYVSFDAEGKSWFTTGLAGGALTPSALVLPADAAPWTRSMIDGDSFYFPAYFGGIERAPLLGGGSTYVSDNDIVDHAFFGTADATDFFLTTPKGVTAYSRATLQKRELYNWPTFDSNPDHRSVAATAGDNLFVAQGDKITVIAKSTGAGKVLVPDLKADAVAKAIVADEETLYVRNGDFELYDASTGAYSKTLLFPPPHAKYPSAIAADATSIYTTANDALVKVPKATDLPVFTFDPFGTPAIGVPTSILLGGDTLWVLDDQRKLFRMPVASGASTRALDGATAGFASAGQQYLVAVDDAKLLVSINGARSRVMITNLAAGASYFLH
jgi:hypothetical protein